MVIFFTNNDYIGLTKAFPKINTIMIGRGILANPGLIGEIKNNTNIDKEVLKEFHDEILNNYIELYNEEKKRII